MSYTKKEYDGVDLPSNPNMPAWILTPKEEMVIFERWRKKAFARCDDLIKAYVECSNSYENPVEAMKKCDAANKRSLACVASYQKMEYLDEERDIMVAEKRAKQKVYRQRMKEAQNAQTQEQK